MIYQASLLALIVAAASPLSAQTAIGSRYGVGIGLSGTGYIIGEVTGRVHVVNSVYAIGSAEIMGGVWGCSDSAIEELRCEYDGHTLSLGAAFVFFDRRMVHLVARALVGRFKRTGSPGNQYTGRTHPSGLLALDGELRLVGPVRLQATIAHRQIIDDVYNRVLGAYPRTTAAGAGIALVF